MKYQITEMGKGDAYYPNKDIFIGQIGEVYGLFNWRNGWFGVNTFIFEKPIEYDGYEKLFACFHQIKLKIVED